MSESRPMTFPSKCHRQLIVTQMAETALQKLDDAIKDWRHRRAISWHTQMPGAIRWSIAELVDYGSAFSKFRDSFVSSSLACRWAEILVEADLTPRPGLVEQYRDGLEDIANTLGSTQFYERWIITEAQGAALDILALRLANGSFPVLVAMLFVETTAGMTATSEDHRDLILRLDPIRLKAARRIFTVIRDHRRDEPVNFELTCNPFFKGGYLDLIEIADKSFGLTNDERDNIHWFLAAAAYVKAFERQTTDLFAAYAIQCLGERQLIAPPLVDVKYSNDDIVSSTKIDDDSFVFIVGTFDKKITIYTEQVRALRLVRALVEEGFVSKERSTAVIGGGVAGLTTAVALQKRGCPVTLFEKETSLLSVQSAASHRFVHPHVFSWPAQGGYRQDAGLPVLDWVASSADVVGSQIRDLAMSALNTSISSEIVSSACIEDVEPAADRRTKLTYSTSGACQSREFDVVIICVGFGADAVSVGGQHTPAYWHPDMLSTNSAKNVLVSGSGDGGIIDCIRAALPNIDHNKIIEFVCTHPEMLVIAKELSKIEIAEAKARNSGHVFDAVEAYKDLIVSDALIQWAKAHTQEDIAVTLNYRGHSPLSSTAAVVNKSILIVLIKAGLVSLIEGDLSSIDLQSYDAVVVRHGPNREKHFEDSVGARIAGCVNAVKLAGKRFSVSDQLDHQTDVFFSKSVV